MTDVRPRQQLGKGRKMTPNQTKKASLILGDGTVYGGKLFGSAKCVAGEVGEFKLIIFFIIQGTNLTLLSCSHLLEGLGLFIKTN